MRLAKTQKDSGESFSGIGDFKRKTTKPRAPKPPGKAHCEFSHKTANRYVNAFEQNRHGCLISGIRQKVRRSDFFEANRYMKAFEQITTGVVISSIADSKRKAGDKPRAPKPPGKVR
jgi:hypothetical protein